MSDANEQYDTARWESYSDLMAVVLMVFALVLSAIMLVAAEESISSSARKAELDAIRTKADERVGIRQAIVDSLLQALSDYQVDIDVETGAIRIDAAVLFGQDKDEVTPAGKEVLDDVMRAYISVFLGTAFRNYLSRIIVEGHTNSDGSYEYNLDLSQRRAQNVLKYIVRSYEDTEWREALRQYMVASGRSEIDLRQLPDGREDASGSRRIELKFSLKDQEMIHELQDMLRANGA